MRAVSLIAMVLLSACSKEAAVNRGLVDAGIAAPAASCMSREMAKRLSADQLQKLSRVYAPEQKVSNRPYSAVPPAPMSVNPWGASTGP